MAEIAAADLDLLVLCSFRYAIGRESYLPELISEIIERYAQLISRKVLAGIAREIREEITLSERMERPKIDARWGQLASWLETHGGDPVSTPTR